MTNRTSMGLLLASVLMAATMVAGCSGSDSGPASDLGDWTIQADSLALTKDLEVSETEAFYFGATSDLDVTGDGRMVVADGQANHIKLLAPNGTLIDTLGRPGGGPGEFQNLSNVQVARGDSIYAYDFGQSRLTVFGPDSPYELARTLTISPDEGRASTMRVLDDGIVAEFGVTMQDIEEGILRLPKTVWRQIGASGTPGDTLLQGRMSRIAFTNSNGQPQVEGIPFDRATESVIGPDARLYHGWTDSLHIQARSPTGDSSVVASIPTDPVPVTEAARDSALSDVAPALRSMVASAMPDTKPAFTNLVVADDGRLWVARPAETAAPDTTTWWVLHPDTKTIREVQLPSDVNLEVIQNGKAYGTTDTEIGAPAVVRYRIRLGD
jgi:hypothetical protein